MNTSELTADEGFGDTLGMLASRRRRLLLAHVSDAETPIPLSTLARKLAAAEHDKPAAAVTPDERQRNEIRLHHADIPPLSAAGLVSYDTQRRVVAGAETPLSGDEWLEMPVVEALEAWNR